MRFSFSALLVVLAMFSSGGTAQASDETYVSFNVTPSYISECVMYDASTLVCSIY